MTPYIHPADALANELRDMREAVATLACQDKDWTSYKAYLMQARAVRAMEEKVASLHGDTTAWAARADITDDALIEEHWLDSIADWLDDYARRSRERVEAGSAGETPFHVSKEESDAIWQTHAERHDRMIQGLCTRHARVMRQRTAELKADMDTFWSMQLRATAGRRR